MATLYELVVNFRNAIDEAKARREFNSRSCLFRFPDDCCDMTCDLLAEYLREHGIYTFQINGKHKYDNQWHHVWLNTFDGVVINITGDQFNGKNGFPNNISSVWVGEENEVHDIFCVGREREENTIFTNPLLFNDFGGTPDFRQKRLIDAYGIIKEYLGEFN